MEASPNQNTVPMRERADRVLDSIDRTLAEYDEAERTRQVRLATDHVMAMEGIALDIEHHPVHPRCNGIEPNL